MFQKILVPVDLADPEFVKPALDTAVELAKASNGAVRLINVIPMTPVMLAEYVPPDFDVQQRGSAEEALAIVAGESGLPATRSRPWCARAASITRCWKRRKPSAATSS